MDNNDIIYPYVFYVPKGTVIERIKPGMMYPVTDPNRVVFLPWTNEIAHDVVWWEAL